MPTVVIEAVHLDEELVQHLVGVGRRRSRPERPRRLPSASISSMKTMHGATLRASAKSVRTRDAPTPTNIS